MSLHDILRPDPADLPGPETFEGVVDETATAGKPVFVVIPEFDPHLQHGPCPWTPIVTSDGIFYPHKGDRCVIVQPAGGSPVIAGWIPTATEPDGVITGAGDKHYTHIQGAPASVWTIVHNLGKRPSVTIVDSSGKEWITEIEHTSDNSCVARFAAAFSGVAYLN